MEKASSNLFLLNFAEVATRLFRSLLTKFHHTKKFTAWQVPVCPRVGFIETHP
jgi:hypothetical protein